MAPLIVQFVCWVLVFLAGRMGLMAGFAEPVEALRVALSAMFVFTAIAHFVPRTRDEMRAMVPPTLPKPNLLVAITGVLELAGAAGLLLPDFRRWASLALATLLLAMFPANIHAAKSGAMVGGRRAMALVPRTALQIFWIACLGWVAVTS